MCLAPDGPSVHVQRDSGRRRWFTLYTTVGSYVVKQ